MRLEPSYPNIDAVKETLGPNLSRSVELYGPALKRSRT
jgi:hypothetical protein